LPRAFITARRVSPLSATATWCRYNDPRLLDEGRVLTEAEASAMLEADVDKEYGAHVASQLKRAATQNQFAALVSLYFAIGTASFS